jgi:5-methyltetrahydrofolate--homocysteine methyltransferase
MWFEPVIGDPEDYAFRFDPDNDYWRFSLEAFRQTGDICQGKFLQEFPDLIEGLDTLASMRGTENLLADLLERPQWVHRCMRSLTDLYFRHYDVLYDLLRDEVGGSSWWIWAPGRLIKLQCDFSAMISASMFREFMVPLLTEMTERVSYTLYHLDGPEALHHVPALCGIPRLGMLQWQPGAGVEPPWDRRWRPWLHEMLDAGKKIMMGLNRQPNRTSYEKWDYDSIFDVLDDLEREFGRQFNEFVFSASLDSVEEAEKLIRRLGG